MSGLLVGLFVTPTITAIEAALASAHAEGKVAVVQYARLARALATKREVVPVGMSARTAKRLAGCVESLDAVEPGSLAAVVGAEIGTIKDWDATLRAWSRAVRDGGAIVLVDRAPPAEISRRSLCGGLTELEQRRVGRAYVTSGLVTHL